MSPHTLSDARALLSAGKISPSELLEEYIRNIEAAEPIVQAWTCLRLEEAREHARKLDGKMSSHDELPALFGIPYGAKDIFCTRGIPTEAGSRVLAGFVPSEDATVVARLAAQDAILLGKTTTTEFANLGNPPPTANPWNVAHTPGGSSSGSAAAMAARMALFTLGTQTAGSLSRPAAFNGLTVLKGTFGRISKAGVFPAAHSLDHIGALTHSVQDSVMFFNAVSGPDPRDETTRYLPHQPLSIRAAKDYVVGLLEDPYFDIAEEVAMSLLDDAIRTLEREGVQVRRVRAPDGFQAAVAAQHVVMQAEVAAYHADTFRTRGHLFHPSLQEFIENGLKIPAEQYLNAQRTRDAYRSAFDKLFEDVGILVTPSAVGPAPAGLGATGSPVFNLPFTSIGVPTLALPIGFSPEGLPVGMQMIAPHLEEQRLVDLGHCYQTITDWHLRRPPMLAA